VVEVPGGLLLVPHLSELLVDFLELLGVSTDDGALLLEGLVLVHPVSVLLAVLLSEVDNVLVDLLLFTAEGLLEELEVLESLGGDVGGQLGLHQRLSTFHVHISPLRKFLEVGDGHILNLRVDSRGLSELSDLG